MKVGVEIDVLCLVTTAHFSFTFYDDDVKLNHPSHRRANEFIYR